jgi:23S rRNA (uracil1939-C5)-methyltransferase
MVMKKGDELTADISALSSEGKGIARMEDGFVIFVEKTLPGDTARFKIKKKKSGYAEARLIEIVNPSPLRLDPVCAYFGVCGGCKIQNYNYDEQVKFKTEAVKNAFERIGGFHGLEIPEAVKGEDIFFYRNKMEFSFSDDRWKDALTDALTDNSSSVSGETPEKVNDFALGLHVPRFHSKIVDIQKCYLQSELSSRIVNFTREFFKSRGTSIYTIKTHSGYLRFLIIRQSSNTADLMVNLITNEYNKDLIEAFGGELQKEFPEITTFINSISTKKAQVAFGDEEYILWGSGYITEKLKTGEDREYTYKISPNSFFQTNSRQAERLYNIAAIFGEFNDTDKVLDLYCGAGSIAIFISGKVNKVLGVELVEDAIKNANENKELNNVNNAEFILSDIKDFIESEDIKGYNKIILDPPRAGLHPVICEILSGTKMERIVYVSCNPSTQARDLAIICGKGNYKIEKVQPVDMFPHTYHVENVVSLVSS